VPPGRSCTTVWLLLATQISFILEHDYIAELLLDGLHVARFSLMLRCLDEIQACSQHAPPPPPAAGLGTARCYISLVPAQGTAHSDFA
jgi:hypothetical protein